VEVGITLIVVPFWWDYSEDQLFQTVVKARPDLLPVLNVDPKLKSTIDPSKAIPEFQPGKPAKKIESSAITPGKDFVLLSKLWNPKNDPTNMWISEKYDGVRAYWDGENMFYRNGNPIILPAWFREKIPKGVHFDGELWAGRLSFILCQRKVSTKEWDEISYQIFDAPKNKGMYE